MGKGALTVLVLAATFVVFLFSGNAYAYRLGEITINPKAAVSWEYDDNIAFAPNDDTRKSDFITKIGGGLNAIYESPLDRLDLGANVTQHIFAKHDDFSFMSYDFNANYQRDLTKHDHIKLTDYFVTTEESTSFQNEFGRVAGRYRTTNNYFNAQYIKEFSERFSAVATYANDSTSYSSGANQADSTQNMGQLEGKFAISSADTFLGMYSYTERDFRHGAKFRINQVGPGWQHYFTPQLYIDTRAGVQFLHATSVDKNNIDGFYSFSLIDDADPTMQLKASFMRATDVVPGTQAFRKNWMFDFRISKQIEQRLRLFANTYFGQGHFSSIGVKDNYTGVNVGFDYDLNKNLVLNCSYTYSQVDSNQVDSSYDKNRVYAGLTLKF